MWVGNSIIIEIHVILSSPVYCVYTQIHTQTHAHTYIHSLTHKYTNTYSNIHVAINKYSHPTHIDIHIYSSYICTFTYAKNTHTDTHNVNDTYTHTLTHIDYKH